MNPKWPVYVVSRKRTDSLFTPRILDQLGVPHKVVIEPDDYDDYSKVLSKDRILIVPDRYHEEYDTCDNLGRTKSQGPGPARNFVWDHAISLGAKWHWVMDDNITHFFRYNKNTESYAKDGTMFRCMEDFCERYINVYMAGPNYEMFIIRKEGNRPPFLPNTRIYSCNLIKNDIPYRWRGRYNVDTDLSLRILKDGFCTVQFNTFLQRKVATQRIKGGNTAEFYAREGTYNKSKMQIDLHPDVSKMTWKFNRWHHHVDYRPFRANKMILREDANIPKGYDEFNTKVKKDPKKCDIIKENYSPLRKKG